MNVHALGKSGGLIEHRLAVAEVEDRDGIGPANALQTSSQMLHPTEVQNHHTKGRHEEQLKGHPLRLVGIRSRSV